MQSTSHSFRRIPRFVLLTPLVYWAVWFVLMNTGERWSLFEDNWFMTVTMCFGSFIAGATSEGGGAVAFPVMTLMFNIEPAIARDFSLMIQSVGMSAATLAIICLGIRVEWRAILFAGIGGGVGIILGLDVFAPMMTPAYVKMFFTSLWLSFALALFWINRQSDRVTHSQIVDFQAGHAVGLVVIGILGGIVSGLTGSGLDVVTFTLLTLFFRVSEKVATPTSVILMAMNAVVGFLWIGVVQHRVAVETWNYWYVCVPVVVIGAPLGAWFISERTRHFIATLLYLSIFVQFTAALLIVPQSVPLVIFSIGTVACGGLLFSCMTLAGSHRG